MLLCPSFTRRLLPVTAVALLLVDLPTGHATGARGLEALFQGVPGPRAAMTIRSNVFAATLQRRIGGPRGSDQAAAHLICETPCQLHLPIRDTTPYRLDADGMQPTPWFSLPGAAATIEGRLVGEGWREWPPALAALGIVAAVLGGTGLGLHQTNVVEGAGWKWSGAGLLGLAGVFFGTALGVWGFGPHSTATITLQ